MCHMSGRGVDRNKDEAKLLLMEAAEKGNDMAKQLLAQNWQGEGLGTNKPSDGHKVFDKGEEDL